MTKWHKVTSMREWMEALDLPVISRCVGMRLPFFVEKLRLFEQRNAGIDKFPLVNAWFC